MLTHLLGSLLAEIKNIIVCAEVPRTFAKEMEPGIGTTRLCSTWFTKVLFFLPDITDNVIVLVERFIQSNMATRATSVSVTILYSREQ